MSKENKTSDKQELGNDFIAVVMCGSCKHWKNNGRGNIGKCMISKIRHPMMHSGCGLYTHEDFGCKLFQSRT